VETAKSVGGRVIIFAVLIFCIHMKLDWLYDQVSQFDAAPPPPPPARTWRDSASKRNIFSPYDSNQLIKDGVVYLVDQRMPA
jgi:hypothetical protein